VIRVGAGVKGQKQGGQEMRLGKDGKPLPSGTWRTVKQTAHRKGRFSPTPPDSRASSSEILVKKGRSDERPFFLLIIFPIFVVIPAEAESRLICSESWTKMDAISPA